MEIDAAAAAALGWPKTKYAHVERERRWLCDRVPRDRVTGSVAIVDIYISGTRLRLREARDLGTSAVQFKLGRKVDVAAAKRLITTIYLSAPEFALLSALPGARLEKLRHTVIDLDGRAVTLDEFGGELAGLILAEVEFADDATMNAYQPPDFLGPEVTDDLRYTGSELAIRDLPTGPRR